jgi:hypothetical protein
MLSTQRHYQLLIRLLLARLVQHTHMRLTSVKRFGGFAQTPREAIVDECDFEHTLQGIENAHPAALAAGICCYFHLVRCGDFDVGLLFSVRLAMVLVLC